MNEMIQSQYKSNRHEPKIKCELKGKTKQNVIATQPENYDRNEKKKNDTNWKEIVNKLITIQEKKQRQIQQMELVKEGDKKDKVGLKDNEDKESLKENESILNTLKQTKRKKSKRVKDSSVENLLKQYHKENGILPDRRKRSKKTSSGFIRLFKFQEEYDQIKTNVSRLVDMCKHKKQLKADVTRLMTYGKKLERCIMCIIRQTQSLRNTIERLNEMRKLEDVERRNELELELRTQNEILEARKKTYAVWTGAHEHISDKWALVDQKFKKTQSTLTFLIKTKMEISKDISTMDKQIESVDIRYEKIIKDFHKELAEIKTRIGQKHKDASNILEEMMKNNENLIRERNTASEELDKIRADVHFSGEEYARELEEMQQLKQHKEALDKRLIEQIDEVKNSVSQVNTWNTEIDEQTELLRELEKQNDECVKRMKENEQYKELLNIVKENIEACKRDKRELVDENILATAMKERLEKPQERRINDDALEALEDLRLDLQLEIDMLQENRENLEETQTMLMLKCSEWKQKLENFEQLKLCDMFKNAFYKLQTQIDEENKRKRKLLKEIEEFEQSAHSQGKQMEHLIAEKESFTSEYKQVLKNMEELDQYKNKKKANLVFLEKEINIIVRKKETLVQNCNALEDSIKEAFKDKQTYEIFENIEGENEELEEKLAMLNHALEEELLNGEEYRKQFETLSEDKPRQDVEILNEIQNNKTEYLILEEQYQELEQTVNELRLRYQDLKDCGEALKGMVKEEKEKRNLRRTKRDI